MDAHSILHRFAGHGHGSAKRSDTGRYASFFRGMLEWGIYLAPSQFEAAFVSTAHGDAEIERTIAAAREALRP